MYEMVATEISNKTTTGNINCSQLNETLKAYPFNHCSINKKDKGKASKPDNNTNLTESKVNSEIIFPTDAPITLRTPISLIRREVE